MARQTKSNNTIGHVLHGNKPAGTLTEEQRRFVRTLAEVSPGLGQWAKDMYALGLPTHTLKAKLRLVMTQIDRS